MVGGDDSGKKPSHDQSAAALQSEQVLSAPFIMTLLYWPMLLFYWCPERNLFPILSGLAACTVEAALSLVPA